MRGVMYNVYTIFTNYYFLQKSRIFTVYSKVAATGVSRRDPPRHGDLDAQILVKKGLM